MRINKGARVQLDEPSQRVTIFFIFVCSAIFLVLNQADDSMRGHLNWLFFSEYERPLFKEIASGQIWRFVTPVFLHFGLLHIIFNMIWLFQLGTLIEMIQGGRKLILLVLVVGAFSNTLQYVINGPLFGGMSGVIYGLLAYAWGYDRWGRVARFYIEKGTFGFMMVWLLLCFTGMFGPVANFAHLGGLLAGLGWVRVETFLEKARERDTRGN